MSFRLGLGVLCVALPFAGGLFVACADSTPPPGFTPVGGGEEGGSTGEGDGGNGWMTPNTTTGNQAGPTTSTGPGGPTTNTSTNTSTSTGGLSCNAADAEPNDSESNAIDLGTVDDDDGDGDVVSGILAGVGDTDWYKYYGDDTFPGVAEPERSLSSSDPVRLCKFMQCVDGDGSPDCPDGTDAATSPDGREGCCGDTGFTMGIECSGTDDDNMIYIRVQTTTNDCVTYSIDYHY
jgi:hypothetical protein